MSDRPEDDLILHEPRCSVCGCLLYGGEEDKFRMCYPCQGDQSDSPITSPGATTPSEPSSTAGPAECSPEER